MGGQIGEALAQQADQAANQKQQQPGAPEPEKLAAAADEVRQATTLMEAASLKLSQATEDAQSMSVDLEPPLEDEKTAIEHLANAIALLTPPQQGDPQDQEDQKDKGEDGEDGEKGEKGGEGKQGDRKPEGDMSQSELERRLRALRENEANRRREREKQPRTGGVEKDW